MMRTFQGNLKYISVREMKRYHSCRKMGNFQIKNFIFKITNAYKDWEVPRINIIGLQKGFPTTKGLKKLKLKCILKICLNSKSKENDKY